MKTTLETRLGIFFALALVAGFIIMEMIGAGDLLKKGYRVRAQFDTVQELKEGDPVKMAGVQVGRVASITLTNSRVEVTMRVEAKSPVKTDSKATVKFAGLLGQNFVAIDFGSPDAPPIAPDSLLETVEQPDLSKLLTRMEEVAAGVESMTRKFTPESLSTLFGPVTDFLQENRPRLSGIFSNLQSVTSEMAAGQGTVGRLIHDDELYRVTLETVKNVEGTLADVKSSTEVARELMHQIKQGQGTLGKLATDDLLYQEGITAMSNLREILEKINRGQGTVAKILNDDSFYKNAKLTLQKVDKATEGLEDQGPLSVLGMAVNSLF